MATEKRNFIQEAADLAAVRQALRYATTHKQPLQLTEAQVALLDRTFNEVESGCMCGRCNGCDA